MSSSTISAPSVTLYTGHSPNGIKISITLEELGLPYDVRRIDMSTSERNSHWCTAINPKDRIPALTDTLEEESEINVFERGSIMLYLVEQHDCEHRLSYPRGKKEWIEMNDWLFFQNARIGPMQGQANHFNRYPKDPHPYARERYQTEMKRLYGVLDNHLASTKSAYLVGEKCTIADIAHSGWITLTRWAGIELDGSSSLKAWEERMFARPAVKEGRQVPDKHQMEMLQDPEAMATFEERAKAFYRAREKEAEEAAASKRDDGVEKETNQV